MTKPVFKVGDVWLWEPPIGDSWNEIYIVFEVSQKTAGIHYISFRRDTPEPIIKSGLNVYFKNFLDNHYDSEQLHYLGNVKDIFDFTEILPDY